MKRSVIVPAVVVIIAISSSAYASPRSRDGEASPRPSIAKIVKAIRSWLGVRPNEEITVPKP